MTSYVHDWDHSSSDWTHTWDWAYSPHSSSNADTSYPGSCAMALRTPPWQIVPTLSCKCRYIMVRHSSAKRTPWSRTRCTPARLTSAMSRSRSGAGKGKCHGPDNLPLVLLYTWCSLVSLFYVCDTLRVSCNLLDIEMFMGRSRNRPGSSFALCTDWPLVNFYVRYLKCRWSNLFADV